MSGFSADDSFFSLSKSTTLHNTKNFPKVSNAPKLQSQLPLNHTNLTKKAEKVKAKDPQTKVIVKKEEQLTLKKFSFILDTKKINSQEVILIDDEDVKPLNLSHESINNKPKAKESKMTTTGKRVALCDLEEVIEDEVTKKQKLSNEKHNLFPIKATFKQHILTPFKPVPGTKPE